jgi:hypothetical protein
MFQQKVFRSAKGTDPRRHISEKLRALRVARVNPAPVLREFSKEVKRSTPIQ